MDSAGVEAGIGVDLDQPYLKVSIYHEIIPEHLESLLPPLYINPWTRGAYRIDH
jgi:hypothetical protein